MKQKRYGILDNISSPADLRGLSYDTLGVLCAALREFIVDSVSQTGGHLASNLGIVELAVALEREFDSSRDRIIYDVGHQCYVHKILTGRRDRFDTLRQYGGLCGFMKPEESITDPCITGHASDSVSVALGMAHARTLKNQKYHVVAVIGDGALTGGMAYEALSSAGTSREPLLVVLNDNNMSIAKNVGGLSRHLSRLRQSAVSACKNPHQGAAQPYSGRRNDHARGFALQGEDQAGCPADLAVRADGLYLSRSGGRTRPQKRVRVPGTGEKNEKTGSAACYDTEGQRLCPE